MRLHFKTNDYLLTWNMLYGASFSQSVHTFKQKLYKTHKNHYNNIGKDLKEMLEDIKNFIPDDDTIYNYVFDTELFTVVKENAEKHRLELLKMWDQNKKTLTNELKDILKFTLKEDYNIIALDPIMDSVLSSKKCNSMAWGRRNDLDDPIKTLIAIIKTIIINDLGDFEKKYKDIIDVILELAIDDELYTRLTGKSTYLTGDTSLTYLKRQIYPYFLMYLGCEQEDFPRYMMRDGITFDIDKYVVERDLKKLNLIEFIEFCIRNQFKIIRINQLEIL